MALLRADASHRMAENEHDEKPGRTSMQPLEFVRYNFTVGQLTPRPVGKATVPCIDVYFNTSVVFFTSMAIFV
jgi:hypothetical protein